jgi:hypothetical protein
MLIIAFLQIITVNVKVKLRFIDLSVKDRQLE